MIVKIQVSLFSSEDGPPALIYNKARNFEVYQEITEDLLSHMNGRPKAYFEITIDRQSGTFSIIKEAGAQPW